MNLPFSFEVTVFLILSGITVATAISVVLQKNPVISAVSLVFTFFALAGVYGLMGAIFIATMQVLVYAGAIMVLVVFVLMLLSQRGDQLVNFFDKPFRVGLLFLLAISFFFSLYQALLTGVPKTLQSPKGYGEPNQYKYMIEGTSQVSAMGNAASVGASTYIDFALPFELISLLLLVAVVGAVSIAKRKKLKSEEEKDTIL